MIMIMGKRNRSNPYLTTLRRRFRVGVNFKNVCYTLPTCFPTPLILLQFYAANLRFWGRQFRTFRAPLLRWMRRRLYVARWALGGAEFASSFAADSCRLFLRRRISGTRGLQLQERQRDVAFLRYRARRERCVSLRFDALLSGGKQNFASFPWDIQRYPRSFRFSNPARNRFYFTRPLPHVRADSPCRYGDNFGVRLLFTALCAQVFVGLPWGWWVGKRLLYRPTAYFKFFYRILWSIRVNPHWRFLETQSTDLVLSRFLYHACFRLSRHFFRVSRWRSQIATISYAVSPRFSFVLSPLAGKLIEFRRLPPAVHALSRISWRSRVHLFCQNRVRLRRHLKFLVHNRLVTKHCLTRLHYYELFQRILGKFERPQSGNYKPHLRGSLITDFYQRQKRHPGRMRPHPRTIAWYSRIRFLLSRVLSQTNNTARMGVNYLRREKHRPRRQTRRLGLTYVRQFIAQITLKGNRDKAVTLLSNYLHQLRATLQHRRKVLRLTRYWRLRLADLGSTLPHRRRRRWYKIRAATYSCADQLVHYNSFCSTPGSDLLTMVLRELEPAFHPVRRVKSGRAVLAPAPLRWKRRVYYACKFLQRGGWASSKWSGRRNNFPAGLTIETLRMLRHQHFKDRKERAVAEDNLKELCELTLKQKDFFYVVRHLMSTSKH